MSVSRQERAALLAAVLIISICALTYELVIATLSSYLLGSSVTQFSFTIGFFLFSMGLGSLLTRQIKAGELRWFILVELIIGIFGGASAVVLYGVFALDDSFYQLMMALLSLIIGICIGLEIPLLMRIVAEREALGTALADVLSIDYIGALVGSLMFPLVLLPLLGVTRTAFLMGLFNIGVATALLQMFRHRISKRWERRLWAACGGAILFMFSGLLLSADLVGIFEQNLYQDRIIHSTQTPYQRIIMTRNGVDIRLFLDGNLQFSSRDEYRYHELLVHPVMSAARSHESVLVLGGGDGLVARELLKYSDAQQIIVVDLDPAITELAQTHPLLRDISADSMRNPRVTVINEDAFNYIAQSDQLFPVVIIDLPDPNNEGLSKLYSETFYRMLAERLTPDGIFITQATSPYFVREAYWMIANTVEASDLFMIPLHTYVPSFGDWGFVIGSKVRLPALQVNSEIDLRYLTSEDIALTAGLDLEASMTTGTRSGSISSPPREGDARAFGQPPSDQINSDEWHSVSGSAAPFVELDIGLLDDRLHVVPGLRFDPLFVSVSRRLPKEGRSPGIGASSADVDLEPRLSARYALSSRVAFKAAYGEYRQPPLAEDLSPVFGNPLLGASSARHLLASGAFQLTQALGLETTVFYTRSRGLAARNPIASPLIAEALVDIGEGRSYGAQFLVRQNLSHGFFGWVAYTLLRSERRDRPDHPYRLFDFDQTHVLTALASYDLGRGFDIGGRVRYATGYPRTPVIDAYYDARRDLYEPVLGAKNSSRIPDFVELDLRFAKRWSIGESELETYLDVQNVTNRENPEEIAYSPDYSERRYVSGLPILPLLGARWSY